LFVFREKYSENRKEERARERESERAHTVVGEG
jgi:hypothetical protein